MIHVAGYKYPGRATCIRIQVDTTCIRAKCVWCKRGYRMNWTQRITKRKLKQKKNRWAVPSPWRQSDGCRAVYVVQCIYLRVKPRSHRTRRVASRLVEIKFVWFSGALTHVNASRHATRSVWTGLKHVTVSFDITRHLLKHKVHCTLSSLNKLCGRRGCGRHGMPLPACNNPTSQDFIAGHGS